MHDSSVLAQWQSGDWGHAGEQGAQARAFPQDAGLKNQKQPKHSDIQTVVICIMDYYSAVNRINH